jgi:hypothetical protein
VLPSDPSKEIDMPTSAVVDAVQLAQWAAVGALVLALALVGVVLGQARVIRRNGRRIERLRYEAARCPLYVHAPAESFPFVEQRLGRCTRQAHTEGACTLNAPRPNLHSDDVWGAR